MLKTKMPPRPTAAPNGGSMPRVRTRMPDAATVRQATEVFAMLADPTRARIVFALSQGELCVRDIAALLGMTLSAVSHQLRLLRQVRLVKFRKEGRQAFYMLDDEHASQLLAQVLEHIGHNAIKEER